MLTNSPDLNDVRIFALAAEGKTLTAAAKELHIPTSTVSRSLTRLEKHLGVLLMQRGPRGLLLTDSGREYLQICRRALRTLNEGNDLVAGHRAMPKGVIKVACPVTMARDVLAPLLRKFLELYPELRVELELYASAWDQEPREDVDVFFKLRAPRDSLRRMRPYPGTARGLFASHAYIEAAGNPANPDELAAHSCIGSGVWKLSRGKKLAAPHILFRVIASDPDIHLKLAVAGVGISILPLWMARRPDLLSRLLPVLPGWRPAPLSLCALFSGPSRLTPKVQALLDFLGEYIGTERDPRLQQKWSRAYFTDPALRPTSAPHS